MNNKTKIKKKKKKKAKWPCKFETSLDYIANSRPAWAT
jgi:hypothetical protein